MTGADCVRAQMATVAAALAALLVVAAGPSDVRDSVNRFRDWAHASATTIVLNPTHDYDPVATPYDDAPNLPVFAVDVEGPATASAEPTNEVRGGSVAFSGVISAPRAASVADDVVVLGKYPDYINLADDLVARRFNVPDWVWNGMSDAERWAANQRFLDRAIARGSWSYPASVDTLILGASLEKGVPDGASIEVPGGVPGGRGRDGP